MKPTAIITTSWDDGHPQDLRIAELLHKYGLKGTFYAPKSCIYGTMTESDLRELSQGFEIGGHTMNHVVLTEADDAVTEREIGECRLWVEQVTGKSCTMFAPPKGKFSHRHLGMIRNAGFTAFRTVELLAIRQPVFHDGLQEMPTTVHAYSHTVSEYFKNIVKRRAAGNLTRYLKHVRFRDWLQVVPSVLSQVINQGGVFHIWGHAWSIDETGQWDKLEDAFRMIGDAARHATVMTNAEICGQSEVPSAALASNKTSHLVAAGTSYPEGAAP